MLKHSNNLIYLQCKFHRHNSNIQRDKESMHILSQLDRQNVRFVKRLVIMPEFVEINIRKEKNNSRSDNQSARFRGN